MRVMTAPVIQQVAEPDRVEHVLRPGGAIGGNGEAEAEHAVVGQFGRDDMRAQVEGLLAILSASDPGPGLGGEESLQGGTGAVASVVAYRHLVLDRARPRRGRIGGQCSCVDPVETRRGDRREPLQELRRLQRLRQLQVDDLATSLDPQPQGQREGHLGPRVEALGRGHRHPGAAEHSLQAAHDVVMADQAKIAALGEAETHLDGSCHIRRSNRPLRIDR